jgi:hypothetical protein
LERAQGIAEIPARASVDHAERKAGAIEQHLRLDECGAFFPG